MSENQTRYDVLTTRLKTRAHLFPRALQRLSDALWNETENPQEHAACLDLVPQVIDAELAGVSIVERYPAVKHHLDRCDTCAREYAALLESEWAEQRGMLASADNLPEPDLSFLPPLKRPLQAVVLEWTRAILLQLAPKNLGDLDLVASSVFAQLTPRRIAEGRSTYKHLFGADPHATNLARTLLTASYTSTREIVAQVSRGQFETWLNQQKLESEVETRALTVARALGFDYDTAKRFAHAFANQVVQDPTALDEFLK